MGDRKRDQRVAAFEVISPSGIDANFFYGEFLIDRGEHRRARQVLTRALHAPARPGRPLADRGRRQEIVAALERLELELGD